MRPLKNLIILSLGISILTFFLSIGILVSLKPGLPYQIKELVEKTASIEKLIPPSTIQPAVLRPTLDLKREGVYLGVVLPDIPGPMSSLIAYEEKVGKKVALVHWFQAWGSEDKDFNKGMVQSLWEHGTIVMISWEPWKRTKDYQTPQPEFQLSKIAAGKYDPYIRNWAKEIKDFGGPILIRWAHEMNGHWYPWSIGLNNNTKEDFIAAWKHIHDIFKEEGANNVQWVWNPNWSDEWTATKVRETYPGSEYVDWIGLTIFNWGTTVPRNKWDSLDDVLGWQYKFAEKYGKPIIIGEFASDETGGSKAQWIEEAFQSLKENYPQVRAVVWFNFPTARYSTKVKWTVDSSPEALKGFREAIKDPYFLGPQFKEVTSQN